MQNFMCVVWMYIFHESKNSCHVFFSPSCRTLPQSITLQYLGRKVAKMEWQTEETEKRLQVLSLIYQIST